MANPPNPKKPLTLIVAATAQRLGIGRCNTLPWPPLRGEMRYFRRVTTRVPGDAGGESATAGSHEIKGPGGNKAMNAVVMGRRTWESIPLRFRPLRGRVNVVVTSRGSVPFASGGDDGEAEDDAQGGGVRDEGPYAVPSLDAALALVDPEAQSALSPTHTHTHTHIPAHIHVPRVFVIGGASLYSAALSHPACTRVLMTRIRGGGEEEFGCDTFFPVELESVGWERRGKGEWREFVGGGEEEGGEQGDIGWEFCLFERG